MSARSLVPGSPLPQQFRTGEQRRAARGGTPHRSSRRSRSRARPGPRSADCPPAPCVAALSPLPASISASSCMPGLCPTSISRFGSCADASRRCLQQLRRFGAVEFRREFDLGGSTAILHRLPGDLPGLMCPDRGRNQHQIRERRMHGDPAADLGGVAAAAIRRAGGPDPARKARQSRSWRDATTSNGAWRSRFVLFSMPRGPVSTCIYKPAFRTR